MTRWTRCERRTERTRSSLQQKGVTARADKQRHDDPVADNARHISCLTRGNIQWAVLAAQVRAPVQGTIDRAEWPARHIAIRVPGMLSGQVADDAASRLADAAEEGAGRKLDETLEDRVACAQAEEDVDADPMVATPSGSAADQNGRLPLTEKLCCSVVGPNLPSYCSRSAEPVPFSRSKPAPTSNSALS